MQAKLTGRLIAALLIAALASPLAARGEPTADLKAAKLEIEQARRVTSLRLDLAGATLKLKDGWAIPTSELEGQVREFVFLGSAHFEMEPPDAIEAGQLELFTGSRRLSRPVSEAVLVIGNDAAAAAVLRQAVEIPDPETSIRASRLYSDWLESGERSTLQVEQMLWVDTLGDPAGADYFVGWFCDENNEQFIYNYDPWEFEQISLGQFVTNELTDRQERKIDKWLGKQQRKGRLIGVDVTDLGRWDSWISASPRGSDGRPLYGTVGFNVQHYTISVDIAPRSLEMVAEATLKLEATVGATRAVPLSLASDLKVTSVTDGSGQALGFRQDKGRVVVVWPEPPLAGDSLTTSIRYRGRVFDERDRARVLRTPRGWYPSVDASDWATYDVAIKWPMGLDLVATGERVEGGREGEQRWERRRFEIPVGSFSFELGKFTFHETQANDVPITLALDPQTRYGVRKDVDKILDTARESLQYFQELFGRYPFDDLKIVSVPRGYSQASPGLVTLARGATYDTADDRGAEERWVLAHEIAHQWWGHVVGWLSYRDQWISEAMANYAAMLYVRNRGTGKRLGPTAGWKSSLLRSTKDGRSIESLGPLVLGRRLLSSRSSSAYYPIVYGKGAVVINMLGRSLDEETFSRVLRALIDAVQGKVISTEDFFDLVERITSTDLDAFIQQFIYGTGLPEVYYDYTVEKTGAGGWIVRGVATQSPPYRIEYGLVERREGQLDIERKQVVGLDVERSTLVVPVQAVLFDPEKERGAEDPERTGNRVMQIDVLLRGRRSTFEFHTPLEPKQVWLDARSEVFGRFFSQRRKPKRVLYYQGLDLANARRWEEATNRLEEALIAPAIQGPSWGKEDSDEFERRESAMIDARIHWLMMQMDLSQGRTQNAQEGFEAAEIAWNHLEKLERSRYSKSSKPSYSTVLEARLYLQKGNPKQAYQTLRGHKVNSREWYLAMALATRALGRDREFEEACEEAEERGADVSLLID